MTNTNTALDVARDYVRRGWRVVPVPPQSKGPILTGWQDLALTTDELPRYFSSNGSQPNVGVILGAPSGGLVDADLDDPYAIALGAQWLPPTDAIFGRRGKQRSHWIYRTPVDAVPTHAAYERPPHPRATAQDERGTDMLIELRSSRHQTVFPGSTHPSGEPIVWDRDGEPALLAPAVLQQVVERIAAGALLASCWTPGIRNSLTLAVSGVLLRAGWSVKDTHNFIKDVAHVAGDDDVRASRQRVEHTAERLAAGEKATGVPTLVEHMGDKEVNRFVTWLRLALSKPSEPPTVDTDATLSTGRYRLTDLGNSERLVAQHGDRLRYCYAWNKWLVYDEGYWRDDRPGLVVALAKQTVRSIYKEAADEPDDKVRAAIASWAKASESHSRIAAMVALSQSALPIDHSEFDPDPWLLNCTNGTIDLRTSTLRAHRPEDWITRQTPVAYDPAAQCLTWRRFLESVLPHNSEMLTFLQRIAGYSATGSVREQCIFFLHGSGSNGKSTFLRTLQTVLGAYAMQAKSELLLAKKDADHPTEVADLFSKRLVVTIEVEDGRRFAEALLKQLTGGDRIRARRMREDHWEFDPTHKILLAANHRPVIRGTDHAIWRRIHLIPFEVTIPDEAQDKDLPDKLRAELPGILSWLVDGCLEWQHGGLRVPAAVRSATEDYRAQMDVIAQHLTDCCECAPQFTEKAGDLYRSYSAYCAANGEKTVLSQRRYGESLTERGFAPDRGAGNVHIRRGLRLRPSPPEDDLFIDDAPVPSQPDSDPSHDPFTGKSDPCDPKSGIDSYLISHESVMPDLGSQGSLRSLSIAPPDDKTDEEGDFILVDTDISTPDHLLTCLYCGTPTPGGVACADHRVDVAPIVAPIVTLAAASRSPATITVGASYPDLLVRFLDTAADVQQAVSALLTTPSVGIDTETTGLDAVSDTLRLVQLATLDTAYVLDTSRVDPRTLTPLFDGPAGPVLTGHNLSFDLRFLRQAGVPIPTGARLFDTMLSAQLLGAGVQGGHLPRGLAAVAQRVLGLTLDKTEQKSDWSSALSDEQLQYAARDAVIPLLIADRHRVDLASAGLTRVAALEMGALPAVAWLEQTGVPFDADGWRKLAEAASDERATIEQELTALAGTGGLFEDTSTIKWSSPAQVAALLRGRGHEVTSTDEASLVELADAGEPLARLLLQHRDASKRVSTYGVAYLQHIHPATGRIHAHFLQLGSDAGRMSCTKPNVQQVPRGKAYRACVRPEAGRVLIKADYAQIEMRLAAEIAGDKRLIEAFQRGDDLHAVTARTVLGKTDVTKEDRQAAKAVNFGLLYGMGAEGLRAYAKQEYGVQWSVEEATAVRAKYFDTYRGLKAWHRSQPDDALDTRTVAGRRRTGITRFTEKLNSPVQGSGADGLKVALGVLWETRHQAPSAAPILVVHDEIVVECDRDGAEETRAWLVDAMRGGMESVLHHVPADVEATICADWSGTPLHLSDNAAASWEAPHGS